MNKEEPQEVDIDYDYELCCDHLTEARWAAYELKAMIYEDR